MTLDDNPLETNEDLRRFIADLRGESSQSTPPQPSPAKGGGENKNLLKGNTYNDDSSDNTLDSSQSHDSLRSGGRECEGATENEEIKSLRENTNSGNSVKTLSLEYMPPTLALPLQGGGDKILKSEGGYNSWESHLKVDGDERLTEGDILRLEQQLTSQAQELQNVNLLSGLPQDGIYAPNGKSIYEMEPAALNAYLLQLKSNGQNTIAVEVQEAYTSAINRLQNYISQKTLINQKQDSLRENRHFNEWRHVRDEWMSRFPEVDTHLDQLADYIEKKAASDPVFEVQLTSRAGKMRAVLQGIQALGIDKKLAAQEPRVSISVPASPESFTASKKQLS